MPLSASSQTLTQGEGLDWIIQSHFIAAARPAALQRLFRSKKSSVTFTPPPGLSCPAPQRTPCCRIAAVDPDVSAPAPLPHCLCYPRCRGGQTGDTGRTGWGKGRWQAAG